MLDFITVVFQAELPLLEIQARSLDLYVNPKNVQQITIVVNDKDLDIDRSWWGCHQDRVVVKNYNLGTKLTGWEDQQICKLLAARDSVSDWSVVLDAKTWFIRDFESDKLFSRLGKPYTGQVPGKPGVFLKEREFVERHYNIKMPNVLGPNGVPYVFHTGTVKELIESFDDFIEFFKTNANSLTEFFLYSGFLISKFGSFDALYGTTYSYLYPMNIAANEADAFDQLFAKIKQHPSSVLTASIHRDTYRQLDKKQLETWMNLLVERRLFATESQALELLNTYIK